MIIIGAGMSGLLAGALNYGSIIYEANPERESNHKALFRCRSDDIGRALGLPFQKVKVYKSIWYEGQEVQPSIRLAHMYSRKVTGKVTARSILNIDPVIRFIPPTDFLNQLKRRCHTIRYETKYNYKKQTQPVISTIPMFSLINPFNFQVSKKAFKFNPIFVNRFEIPDCDSHCTIYYPDPNFNAYRASLIGNTLITEGMYHLSHDDLVVICESMGIPFKDYKEYKIQNHKQQLGKITPIPNETREKIITELTLKHNIYSLGRFATWRPKVILDDVFKDISVIQRLIRKGNYSTIKHQQGEKS